MTLFDSSNFSSDMLYIYVRDGSVDNPYIDITEKVTISQDRAFLKEVPEKYSRVIVKNGTTTLIEVEKKEDVLSSNNFFVDYREGVVFVHNTLNGNKDLTFKYKGTGAILYPASRIYINGNNAGVNETVQDLMDSSRDSLEAVETAVESLGSAVVDEKARKDAEIIRLANETARKTSETARGTAETARATAESTRVTTENARKTAETSRGTAETARASAETTRSTNETARVSSESTRVSDENTRKSNETTRTSDENTRKTQETARASAESSRVTVESKRVTDETARTTAEGLRVTAENARKSSETTRTTDETTRNTNENTRKTNETARATAETNRVSVESVRVTAENTRKTNETARVESEDIRNTQETTRQSNEDTRKNNEVTRIASETTRGTNETARVNAENTRKTAETARGTAETTRATSETARGTAETARGVAENERKTAETSRVTAETSRQTSFSTALTNVQNATTNAVTSAQNAQAIAENTMHKGEYNALTTYLSNNIITYRESSYMCIFTSKGNLPTNTQYFRPLALKGADGTGSVDSVNGFGGIVVLKASDVGAYTKAEIESKLAGLVDSAPDTLNTLKELASALGDDPNFATTITGQIGAKVDKVAGKDLSTNDYTTADKTKLAGIATSANNYIHPSTHPASIITQDASNRFVTDTEKANWNAKASATVATTSVNGLLSSTDKAKLDGITAGANIYTHPSTHPASIIVQDASNRFVTDAEKTAWNAKATTATATTTTNGLIAFEDKVKLNGITAGANKILNHINNGSISVDGVEQIVYTHPSTHPASAIVQDANNRFMTDVERTKLSGIATSANNYVHPTGAGSNHIPTGGATGNFLKYSASGTAVWATPTSVEITESTTKKFVSDTNIADWNAKETTVGSQNKATKALDDAKIYTDSKAKYGNKFEWQYNSTTNSLDLVVLP